MATLKTLYGSDSVSRPELNENFGVDYVVDYHIPPSEAERAEAEAIFIQLVKALAAVGFATEVRHGGKSSLLIFLKITSDKLLHAQVYRHRLQDWLYGVRASAPNKQDLTNHFEEEPVSEAERLRLAYMLICKPKNEGGAGITPRSGQWKHVASVFPLHDHRFNRDWIKRWSTKYILDDADLNEIRDKFGENVAFYFAFLQSYFKFLVFPAAFGFAAWLVLGKFSWVYALVNCLWSVVFFEYWKKKEVDLAVQWGVRGVSKIQQPRPQFQHESEAQDPVTGEIIKVFPPLKRLSRQLLQIPFAIACMGVLGSLIFSCFAIEIFITEVYNGPFKQYLTFLPTVLLTIFMPALTALLTSLADKLTALENYETEAAHHASFVQKMFVINFITAYMPLFLTAFVYIPFGKVLAPHLDVFQVTARKLTKEGKGIKTKEFHVNPDRFSKQMFYFTVTAQIVNLLLEVFVPYFKRKVFKAVEKVQDGIHHSGTVHHQDSPEEAAFLGRVRDEAMLEVYDVTTDYREMVVQFGYLSLFSVAFPLTACSFLINNWVEARSDAMKIAIGSQRPIPWRNDTIGPWLTSLGFLSWLGSLTSAAVVYLFSSGNDRQGPDGRPSNLSGWALLLSIFVAEHVYLVVQLAVRYVVEKLDSPGLQKERAERFALRKRLLDDTLGHDEAEKAATAVLSGSEKITRDSLEEEARIASTKGHGSPEESFWLRQRGAGETIEVGRRLISEVESAHNATKTVHALAVDRGGCEVG
ncbi:hypothetical protein OOU_Y34scaffold00584g2 [Pyricularia oryzae Y34]|nr:hypothetical protein OOU_Y34scaffold00584g2 [Pyricularia oryzae Y34]